MSRDSSEGCLAGDGADVAATEAEIGEFAVVEPFELAHGLAVAAPAGELGEDHGCEHGLVSVRVGVMSAGRVTGRAQGSAAPHPAPSGGPRTGRCGPG